MQLFIYLELNYYPAGIRILKIRRYFHILYRIFDAPWDS